MLIDKDSLQVKINGMEDYISLGQYLVEAKYTYNKLWSNDSGRNLAGKQSGTLVGIFVKIICQFRKLTQAEVELLAPILDSPRQSLIYYDPLKKTNVTMNTYTGDWELDNKNIVGTRTYIDGTTSQVKNEGFSISFIAISRRA